MAFIAFLGCDGSGKSAVIEQLTERLQARDIEVTCGHWRPQAISRGNTASHLATADDPHAQAPRGVASSILKLGWLWLNWWLGWWKGLRGKSNNGYVIFDRYHGDLLVDQCRYRYGGPLGLAKIVCRLMPQPDFVFFLDAEPDVLLSRKQEVGREALINSRKKYLKLTKSHSRFRVIDASRPLEEVVDLVESELKS